MSWRYPWKCFQALSALNVLELLLLSFQRIPRGDDSWEAHWFPGPRTVRTCLGFSQIQGSRWIPGVFRLLPPTNILWVPPMGTGTQRQARQAKYLVWWDRRLDNRHTARKSLSATPRIQYVCRECLFPFLPGRVHQRDKAVRPRSFPSIPSAGSSIPWRCLLATKLLPRCTRRNMWLLRTGARLQGATADTERIRV